MKKLFIPMFMSAVLSTQLPAFKMDANEFDYYFDRVADRFFSDVRPLMDKHNFINYPTINVYEKDSEYLIEVEIVGVEKDDIEVSISDNRLLTISGESKKRSKGDKALREESFFGKFQRTITLPQDIDSSKIDVKYDNGLLVIKVARDSQKSGKRVIPIK